MPIWVSYLPTIISAVVQLVKLLVELAEKRDGKEIKECSLAIEEARKSGDTKKLEELIKRMKEGKSCD